MNVIERSRPLSSDPLIRIDATQKIMTSGAARALARLLYTEESPEKPVTTSHATYGDIFNCRTCPLQRAVLAEGDGLRLSIVSDIPRQTRRDRGIMDIERYNARVDRTYRMLAGIYGESNMTRARRARDIHHFVIPGAVISVPFHGPGMSRRSFGPRDCIGHDKDGRDFGRIMVNPGRSAHERIGAMEAARRAMCLLKEIWPILYPGMAMPPLDERI